MYSFKYKNKTDRNTAVILITGYIYSVWISKKNKFTKEQTIGYFKSKLYYDRWILKNIFMGNIGKVFNKKYLDCKL